MEKILSAMIQVDRMFFAPYDAYADQALSIGYGQTISQPSTVARMLMIADLKPGDEVLELGSGSGWNASLIAYLVYPGRVLSLEVVPELTELSKANLERLKNQLSGDARVKLHNVEFKCLNIFDHLDNWDDQYNKIILTAGLMDDENDRIVSFANKLLKEEGILICPRNIGPLIIAKKRKGRIEISETSEEYGFVPLIT